MTNEAIQDAEESATIEKTAIEQSELTPATAEAVAPDTAMAAAVSEVPAIETAPAQEADQIPETPAFEPAQPAAEITPEPAPALAITAPAAPVVAAVEESIPSGEIDFGAILEQFEQEQTVFHTGELVEGTVVGITDRGVLVDFGYKSEGFVPVEEFTGPDGEITATVGEPVEVIIRSIHSGDAAPQLSRIDAL